MSTLSRPSNLSAHAASRLHRAVRACFLSATLAVGGLCGTLLPQAALAAAPMVKTQAPGYFRVMLGAFEMTALSDGTVDLPVDKLLQEPAAVTQGVLAKAHLSSPLETSVNAFLINTGERLVLVDVGAGALFGPTLGKLLDNLRAAGYQPDQVDDIVITHMHPDHVGGLAAQGVVAFPNATVHADRRDAEFWLSQAHLDAAPAESKGFFQGAMASVNPYVAAGRFKPFDAGAQLLPGLRSMPAYGHTVGHTVYAVESQGSKMLLIGDLIHVAAVQLDRPGVTIGFDSDPKQALAARLRIFAQAAKDGVIVGAAHLPFPALGRLQAAGTAYRWMPLNYTAQQR